MKRACKIAKLNLKLYNPVTTEVSDVAGLDATFFGDYPTEYLSDYEKENNVKVLNCEIADAVAAFAILTDKAYLANCTIHVPEKRGGKN